MTDPRIKLRNRSLAAVLAFVFPGAGHLYQRRYFKAGIYCFCILGIYFWGCSLGEAKAVHARFDPAEAGKSRHRTIGFLAQAGIGLPAMPAVGQLARYRQQNERHLTAGVVLESFDTEFSGRLFDGNDGSYVDVTGRVTGDLKANQYASGVEFEGKFAGTASDGRAINEQLHGYEAYGNGALDIGPRVCGLDNITITALSAERPKVEFAADRRRFMVRMVDPQNYAEIGLIEGSIPRSFFDHYQAPLSDEAMQHLSGKLGRYYELALVYTWIAGLLNILAVWDAYQGPAYGYGDEVPEEESSGPEKDKAAEEPAPVAPEPAAVARAEPVVVAQAEPPPSSTPEAKS